MYYPEFPKPGDCLGICAPSAGVGHKTDSFEVSLRAFHRLGYRIRETGSVRTGNIRSADAATRGEEFNRLIEDPEVRAVLSASGGEYNLEMLPYVDWEAVCLHPKWIAGASDPTNLLYPITTKLDIATIYGFNAGSFDWEPLHAFQTNALSLLGGQRIRQDSFERYDGTRSFSAEGPSLTEEVYWDLILPDGSPAAGDGSPSLEVSGRLLGGCLDCIARLIGTPFDGTADFLERYSDEKILWYFDPFQMNADTLYLTLLQMKYCGYFRTAEAVIFGRVMFTEGSSDEDYIERLKRVFDVPVLWNTDIGHVKPCLTLINGAVARIRCSAGKGSLEMALL